MIKNTQIVLKVLKKITDFYHLVPKPSSRNKILLKLISIMPHTINEHFEMEIESPWVTVYL